MGRYPLTFKRSAPLRLCSSLVPQSAINIFVVGQRGSCSLRSRDTVSCNPAQSSALSKWSFGVLVAISATHLEHSLSLADFHLQLHLRRRDKKRKLVGPFLITPPPPPPVFDKERRVRVMQIWPRDFWWNPHLFCSLSTSTFGTAWRAPAHATLERTAAFKGECLHLGYQMLGTGFTWVTQWAMQKGGIKLTPASHYLGFHFETSANSQTKLPIIALWRKY